MQWNMSAFKELTLTEALELTNQAIEEIQRNLTYLAADHLGKGRPSTYPDPEEQEFVNTELQRRKENKAAHDRMILVMLELISREFSIKKEE